MAFEVRRIVSGHNAQGKSIFIMDGNVGTPPGRRSSAGTSVVELWQTGSTPPDLTGSDATAAPHGLEPPAGGCNWRVVVFPEAYDPDFLVRTDTMAGLLAIQLVAAVIEAATVPLFLAGFVATYGDLRLRAKSGA